MKHGTTEQRMRGKWKKREESREEEDGALRR